MEGRQLISNLPTGTLTVLHTNIEDSTALTRHLREQYLVVLATHHTLLRAAFTASEGWEVGTQGDAFLVMFCRATQAVAAACRFSAPVKTLGPMCGRECMPARSSPTARASSASPDTSGGVSCGWPAPARSWCRAP
jgi:Adenylate and Guanylate cyclase catalytic domain